MPATQPATLPMADDDPAVRLAKIREATRNIKRLKLAVVRLAEQSKETKEDLKAAQVTLLELGDPQQQLPFGDSEDEDDDEELGD